MSAASRETPSLRAPLPARFLDRPEPVGTMRDRLPALLDALADRAPLERALDRLRERLIERLRPRPDAHFHRLDRVDALDLSSPVARRAGFLCHISRTAEYAEIVFPGNRLRGPLAIEPAFRFIAASEQASPSARCPTSSATTPSSSWPDARSGKGSCAWLRTLCPHPQLHHDTAIHAVVSVSWRRLA